MSPLPERRKSAEELAELRESLGISADGPPPGVPGVRPDEGKTVIPAGTKGEPAKEEVPVVKADAVFEKLPEAEVAAEEGTEEKPVVLKIVHSLKRSERGPIEIPKVSAESESGKLPVRRHTEKELMRLKHQEPVASEPPAVHLQKLTLHRGIVVMAYGLIFFCVGLVLLGEYWSKRPTPDLPSLAIADLVHGEGFGTQLLGFLAGSCVVILLFAGWMAWKKPRSRHHAGFLTIIAVLVLVFGLIHFLPELHGA